MQRTLKFTKYLPCFGWKPFVLTVKETKYDLYDTSLNKEIPPECEVLRANYFNSKEVFSIKGKYPNILSVPDSYWTWFFFAIAKAMQVIRKESIDMLYSTSPIPTAHLIAMYLKNKSNLPWVADFRDPFANKNNLPYKWIYTHIEKNILAKGDKIITNTDLLRDDFMSKYPFIKNDKIVTLTNGYDEKDFSGIVAQENKKEKMIFIHTGEIYSTLRNPVTFLRAFSELTKEGSVTKEEVDIYLIGSGDYVKSHEFVNTLASLQLLDNVKLFDHITHSECIQALYDSSVLLLFQQSEDASLQIPAKAFEYIRVGKPILTLAPHKSATANLMNKVCYIEGGNQHSCVLDPDDLAAIKKGIAGLYCKFKKNELECRGGTAEIREKYERKKITEKLADIFSGLVEQA